MGIDGANGLSKAAIFLDRDGVLIRAIVRNGLPFSPMNLGEMEIIPGVSEACTALREAGFLLIMVTNQPDVARGKQSRSVVESMNAVLCEDLKFDDCRVCFHDDADQCNCRKPRPGMLLAAAHDFDIDLGRSFMIGDRWRDIEAGRSAGCRTIFVDYGYDEKRPEHSDHVTTSLSEAASWILESRSETKSQAADSKGD